MTAKDHAAELLAFIEASPTPYHAVAETARRLDAAGFSRLKEEDAWPLPPGSGVYVVRGGGSIAALRVGRRSPHESGFRLVGAHTDSPNLRLRPRPDVTRHGYRQLGVEIYGGVLLSTWLDRDLSIAGRVVVADGRQGCREHLVDLAGLVARVPNLAIHLNRKVNDEGLKLNPQSHMVPVLGLADLSTRTLPELLAAELGSRGQPVEAAEVLGWDLCFHDAQPPCRGGAAGELLFAPRLDNLGSCYAAVAALLAAPADADATYGIVLYDHEEVGSASAQGAGSTFLIDLLSRVTEELGGSVTGALQRAVARSFLVSADMAHGIHPNYAEVHEPAHQPRLGGGPVIKRNASQRYATDAASAARFARLCRAVEVPFQDFVVRSDMPCGSTIGPISAARVGIATVDVGAPMLSMHSAREMAAASDVGAMVKVMGALFAEA